MGILIDAPRDRARWDRERKAKLAEQERERKARLAEEREYGFNKGYSDGFAKGFAEGRAEAFARVRAEDWHRRSQDWYRRYMDARSHGKQFDEPPPEPPSTP